MFNIFKTYEILILQIPRVDEPSKIYERLKEFADDHKKKD